MAYDFHYTPSGTGVISGKEVLEQTEDAINDLGTQISGDVQTAIDTANNALNTANTASADAQNAVNTANTAYTAATNAQNTANAAQNTASNALTAAQNAQNDVNALGNRVTTAENNITQNTSDISGLTTRMGTAEGNITTLQNDVVTAQATANSAQQTATTARGQAYVVRYASVAVSDNSTVPYTDLNNTDNIKANDLLLDINGKIYQISSVDTANETVSVTTPLTVLALDANVVHTNEINSSGIGIIEGVKEVGGVDFNTLTTQGLYGTNASGSTNNPVASPCVVQVIRRLNSVIQIANVSSSAYKSRYIRYCVDITDQSPVWQSWIRFATDDEVVHKSGNETISGNKTFSSINGVEPGSLSLPDLDNGIDISGFITGGNSHNEYTPPVDGWISVILKTTGGSCGVFLYQGGMANGHDSSTSLFNEGEPCAMANLPVKAGTVVIIDSRYGKYNYVYSAKFYPCQGNV